MLDNDQRDAREASAAVHVLAFGYVPDTRRSGGGQGTAWHRTRVVWESLAVHDRRRRVAPLWWRARRGNRSAYAKLGCRIHSAIHGSYLYSRHDVERASASGPRGLVYADRRDMFGNLCRQNSWSRRG